MVLYHGTSTKHLPRILKEGLLPRSKSKNKGNWEGEIQSKPNLVYLTTAYPVYFAMCAASEPLDQLGESPLHVAIVKKPQDLVVLKVEVEDSDLYPDEDFIARQLHRQGDYPSLKLPEVIKLTDPIDYKQFALASIDYNGIAAIRSVKPEQILDHVTIPHTDWMLILGIGGDSMPIPMNYLFLGKFYVACVEALFKVGSMGRVRL